MIEQLQRFEREFLRDYLQERSLWHSLFITYEKPHVERLWRQWDEYRIYLHKIYPCSTNESLYHPHPWPSAIHVLHGQYEMGLGIRPNSVVLNVGQRVSSRFLLREDNWISGFYYEMLDPNDWHYVCPHTIVYSIMLTGKPFENPTTYANIGKNINHQPLDDSQRDTLLDWFTQIYVK